MMCVLFIGARSEALASELLEVQGLQNMLDTLMDWVGQAENEMTIAEATLISDDLETLEKQLAEHEVIHYSFLHIVL